MLAHKTTWYKGPSVCSTSGLPEQVASLRLDNSPFPFTLPTFFVLFCFNYQVIRTDYILEMELNLAVILPNQNEKWRNS